MIKRCHRFRPTPQEIIELFLMRRAMNQPLVDGYEIIERSLYGDQSPWDVFNADDPWEVSNYSKQRVIYCFSKIIAKGGQSSMSRIVRTAGCGTWDGKAVSIKIYNLAGEFIGHRRAFTFKPKNREGYEDKGKWIMHEYSLADPQNFIDQDCVFCRITHYTEEGGENVVNGEEEDDELPKSKARKKRKRGDFVDKQNQEVKIGGKKSVDREEKEKKIAQTPALKSLEKSQQAQAEQTENGQVIDNLEKSQQAQAEQTENEQVMENLEKSQQAEQTENEQVMENLEKSQQAEQTENEQVMENLEKSQQSQEEQTKNSQMMENLAEAEDLLPSCELRLALATPPEQRKFNWMNAPLSKHIIPYSVAQADGSSSSAQTSTGKPDRHEPLSP